MAPVAAGYGIVCSPGPDLMTAVLESAHAAFGCA